MDNEEAKQPVSEIAKAQADAVWRDTRLEQPEQYETEIDRAWKVRIVFSHGPDLWGWSVQRALKGPRSFRDETLEPYASGAGLPNRAQAESVAFAVLGLLKAQLEPSY